MSEEEQQQESQPVVKGPGAILKEAREKLGLSTEQIAAKLHLKQVSVQAIENDEYDPAISVTFTKGYLKLYAKQVNVPQEVIVEAFEQHHTQDKEPAKLQSFSKRVAKQANDDRLMLITYVIIAVVVALVVIWWFQQDSGEPITSSQSQVTEPRIQSTPGAQAAQVGQSIDESQDTLSRVADESADDLTQEAEQVVEQAPESVLTESDNVYPESQPMAAQPIELVFEFSGNCWMNLVDATGEAIAYGVKKTGRVMPVSGVPPFEVTLGAPELVRISYDGVAVDMSRFDAGKTARFTLPFAQ